ncbi:MAG: hypothetical protein JST70_13815 [Bacteroidetes bacterium]|nr:hypothetical protein [Bacteroidota bacterium]
MRKVTAIVVFISYMLCALGITLSYHHCKGEFRYVQVHPEKTRKCCKGKKMPRGCCKTVKLEFKKSDDRNREPISFQPKILVVAKLTTQRYNINPLVSYQQEVSITPDYLLRPPPLIWPDVPIYLSNSVYRI